MQSPCPQSVQIGRAQGETSRKNWKGRVCWDFRTVTLKSKCTVSLLAAVSLLVWQPWPAGPCLNPVSSPRSHPCSPSSALSNCWHCEVGQERAYCSRSSANDTKQVEATSTCRQIKAQRNPTAHSPSQRSLPSHDSLPQQRLHCCLQKPRRDHENRCHHITHKGNKYWTWFLCHVNYSQQGTSSCPKGRAITSLCLTAVDATSPGSWREIWISGPTQESAFWQDLQVICVHIWEALHVGHKCYVSIDTFCL